MIAATILAAMRLTTDDLVFWQWGFFKLNGTIVYTWVVMAALAIGSLLATRRLSSGKQMDRWQNFLEVIVGFLRGEIRDISRQDPDPFLPFIATIFLFIATATVLDIVPGFESPVISLSTTAALAVCVFLAVPIYGVAFEGVGGYLKNYVKPSWFMLPFNVIGEVTRTLALAVRLFGNVMSGAKVVGILISLVGVLWPAVMMFVGLFVGLIQAYIFAVLAMVYIASGMRRRPARQEPEAKVEEAEAHKVPEDAEQKGRNDD
jgi:F-type H+-transporting ATPase subunit a